MKVKHCPYNNSHVELQENFQNHLLNCPDKNLIEPFQRVLTTRNKRLVDTHKITQKFPNPNWHNARWYDQHIVQLSQRGRKMPNVQKQFKTWDDVGYVNGMAFTNKLQTPMEPYENIFNFGLSYEETVRKLDGTKRFCPNGYKSLQDIGYMSGVKPLKLSNNNRFKNRFNVDFGGNPVNQDPF